jgi:transcriptional regulator with XRE-family HTH domain
MSSRRVVWLRAAFGRRLRALRRARALSQEGLGLRAGLSGKFIGEVERGEKSISLDSLQRLAKVLRARLPELVNLNADGADPRLEELWALGARHRHRLAQVLRVLHEVVG